MKIKAKCAYNMYIQSENNKTNMFQLSPHQCNVITIDNVLYVVTSVVTSWKRMMYMGYFKRFQALSNGLKQSMKYFSLANLTDSFSECNLKKGNILNE